METRHPTLAESRETNVKPRVPRRARVNENSIRTTRRRSNAVPSRRTPALIRSPHPFRSSLSSDASKDEAHPRARPKSRPPRRPRGLPLLSAAAASTPEGEATPSSASTSPAEEGHSPRARRSDEPPGEATTPGKAPIAAPPGPDIDRRLRRLCRLCSCCSLKRMAGRRERNG